MLIKSADDKTKDIQTLRGLLTHPSASDATKRKIEQEIRFMQSGIKGENDAAYEIEFHYKASKNWAVIHDLRVEHAGRVAQIDHILINRFLDVWVCESKRFSEGIGINEHGEFSAFFNSKPYGVPSPLEQNQKHCAVLKSMFTAGIPELPKRLGFAINPDIRSLVLISKNARISRPKTKLEGLTDIIKVDQLISRIEKSFEGDSVFAITKVISSESLETFARSLAALHVPATFDWAARFGLSGAEPQLPAVTALTVAAEPPTESVPAKSKLDCKACGVRVEYKVAKFCWFNKAKFEGSVYCVTCQKKL